MNESSAPPLQEVLPKSGLVFSEKGCLTYSLCKPKIMPIKSVTLQKLEEMERKAAELGRSEVDLDARTVEATVAAATGGASDAMQNIRKAAAEAEAGTAAAAATAGTAARGNTTAAGGEDGAAAAAGEKKSQPDVWRNE